MNDILPIVLSILAALVVIGGLIPVLLKTRRNITRYPGTRDANDPEIRSGGSTAVADRDGTIERKAPEGVDLEGLDTTVPDTAAGLETIPVETPLPVAGRLTRLRERLVRSNNIMGKGLLALLSSDRIDESVWDEVEETLLLADLGTEPTMQLVDALRERVKVLGTRTPEHVKTMLREELIKLVDPTMDRSLNVQRHADKPAGSMTISEQRRLAVARSLATNPRILLMDEVMAGLNPSEVKEAVDVVLKIREQGIATLIVEHVLEGIMPIADKIVVLDRGRKIADGTPQEVSNDATVIHAYLGDE